MGLSMMFYYRRNLDGIPMSIQRAMHKQAMRDAYPHVFSDEDLSEIVDKKSFSTCATHTRSTSTSSSTSQMVSTTRISVPTRFLSISSRGW